MFVLWILHVERTPSDGEDKDCLARAAADELYGAPMLFRDTLGQCHRRTRCHAGVPLLTTQTLLFASIAVPRMLEVLAEKLIANGATADRASRRTDVGEGRVTSGRIGI
jgi:hypothetical protein